VCFFPPNSSLTACKLQVIDSHVNSSSVFLYKSGKGSMRRSRASEFVHDLSRACRNHRVAEITHSYLPTPAGSDQPLVSRGSLYENISIVLMVSTTNKQMVHKHHVMSVTFLPVLGKSSCPLQQEKITKPACRGPSKIIYLDDPEAGIFFWVPVYL
jgi:hypothetical protein